MLGRLNIENEDHKVYADRKSKENTRITDRELYKYEGYLGINIKDFVGKKVLDLGTGAKNSFSKEAKALGVDVVSITADTHRSRMIRKENPNVFARAQQLPFPADSFDNIVSLFAVPHYLPYSPKDYKAFIDEVVRVLKPKGKGYFSPVRFDQYNMLEELFESYSNPNFTVDFKEIEFSDSKERRMVLTKKG